MPDIDVDFCIRGRAEVIRYVRDKYGADRVAQIATFGTLKAKAAIKDVGRASGFSFAETDAIAKLIPAPKQGFDYPLTEAMKMEPRLRELMKSDARVKTLIDHALRLEGLVRHASNHAAGVVLSNLPLVEHLPLFVDKEGGIVTQYEMSWRRKDRPGQVRLSRPQDADVDSRLREGSSRRARRQKSISTVCRSTTRRPTRRSAKGNTTGIFQLESTGIREMTVQHPAQLFRGSGRDARALPARSAR